MLISPSQEASSSTSQNEKVNFTQDGDGEVAHESAVSESNNNTEQELMDVFRKDITSLKSFRETVAKKLCELEKTLIISQQTKPSSSLAMLELVSKIGKSDFVWIKIPTFFKRRVFFFFLFGDRGPPSGENAVGLNDAFQSYYDLFQLISTHLVIFI